MIMKSDQPDHNRAKMLLKSEYASIGDEAG